VFFTDAAAEGVDHGGFVVHELLERDRS
jgi:hypothetical protein